MIKCIHYHCHDIEATHTSSQPQLFIYTTSTSSQPHPYHQQFLPPPQLLIPTSSSPHPAPMLFIHASSISSVHLAPPPAPNFSFIPPAPLPSPKLLSRATSTSSQPPAIHSHHQQLPPPFSSSFTPSAPLPAPMILIQPNTLSFFTLITSTSSCFQALHPHHQNLLSTPQLLIYSPITSSCPSVMP